MAKKNSKKSLSLTLRNYFIAGVVVLIPIGFTLYLSKILIGVSSNLIPANDLKFDFGINSPSCLVENMTIAGI